MKINNLSIMAAALLVVGLTACGGKQRNSTNESENSTEETTLPKEHPFFGNILNFYGEKLKEGVNYNIIKQEIGEVIDKAKELGLPVKGDPYGIKTSKAIIDDWNIQSSSLNLVVKFIPEEGTDFSKITSSPYGHQVYCKAMSADGVIYERGAHYYSPKPNLYVTLIIKSNGIKGYDSRWDNFEYIELSDSE